jgi:hypothetical protein
MNFSLQQPEHFFPDCAISRCHFDTLVKAPPTIKMIGGAGGAFLDHARQGGNTAKYHFDSWTRRCATFAFRGAARLRATTTAPCEIANSIRVAGCIASAQ